MFYLRIIYMGGEPIRVSKPHAAGGLEQISAIRSEKLVNHTRGVLCSPRYRNEHLERILHDVS